MSEVKESPYKKVTGMVTIYGQSSEMTFKFEGVRCPGQLKEMPAYVATLVQGALLGVTDSEAEGFKKRIADLQKQVDEKIAENAALKKAKGIS